VEVMVARSFVLLLSSTLGKMSKCLIVSSSMLAAESELLGESSLFARQMSRGSKHVALALINTSCLNHAPSQ